MCLNHSTGLISQASIPFGGVRSNFTFFLKLLSLTSQSLHRSRKAVSEEKDPSTAYKITKYVETLHLPFSCAPLTERLSLLPDHQVSRDGWSGQVKSEWKGPKDSPILDMYIASNYGMTPHPTTSLVYVAFPYAQS